jgi:hypothetical protein
MSGEPKKDALDDNLLLLLRLFSLLLVTIGLSFLGLGDIFPTSDPQWMMLT